MQTYSNFDIFEINYGEDNFNLDYLIQNGKKRFFYQENLINHAHAMNYLLNKVFIENDYDICFFTNMDDFYSFDRFEKQIDIIERGYDLTSSEYQFVYENQNYDILGSIVGLTSRPIDQNIVLGICPIAQPVVCMTKHYWLNYGPYLPEEVPREDINLWVRSRQKGAKMINHTDVLLFYRLHSQQVTKTLM